jgi:SAM-dependent methyltransferase
VTFEAGIKKTLRGQWCGAKVVLMGGKHRCLVCGVGLAESTIFYNMPDGAQELPESAGAAAGAGMDLRLCICPNCGLVQFDCEPVAYYRDVIRSGGYSTTMTDLRRRQYAHLIEAYQLEGKHFLEVGCGQGEFLQVLEEFPVHAHGVEHKPELVALARGKGLDVWEGFARDAGTDLWACRRTSVPLPGEGGLFPGKHEYDDGGSKATRGEPIASADGRVRFDAFLSFNFLEHQPDPVGMMRCIYENTTGDAVGLVTVPSLEYILQYDGYYELIRDHLAYFTFGTLGYLMECAGFRVLEEELVNRDTLALVVGKRAPGAAGAEDAAAAANAAGAAGAAVVGKRVTGAAGAADVANAAAAEDAADALPLGVRSGSGVDLSRLALSLADIGAQMDALVAGCQMRGESLALWGAGHQGVTLSATTAVGTFAKYIIDSAPFKQGKFAPVSGLPIVAPGSFFENPVDVILIVAPGYTQEIASSIWEKYGGGVRVWALRSNRIEEMRRDGGPSRR